MNGLPQPPLALTILSGLTFTVILYFEASLVGIWATDNDPFSELACIFFAPICLIIAILLYRGTFRRISSAAKRAGVACLILSGFTAFGLVANVLEALSKGASWFRLMPLIFIMLAFCGHFWGLGRLNLRWSHKLVELQAEAKTEPRVVDWRLEIVLGLAALAAMVGIARHTIVTMPPKCGEHLAASAAPYSLPKGASDVSYCKGPGRANTVEFTCEEDAFRAWAEEEIVSLGPGTSAVALEEIRQPFTILRYNAFMNQPTGPREITVSHGLSYNWYILDHVVCAAYDRTNHRAYYHRHLR